MAGRAWATDGPVLVVGDGAVRYLELLAPRPGLDLGLGRHGGRARRPAVLARLAARRLAAGAAPLAAGDVVPDYRRHADARINWEERVPRRAVPHPPAGTPVTVGPGRARPPRTGGCRWWWPRCAPAT